ncbi:MAG: hypothetical protein Q9186_003177 [Xanthomendoza sp. 1 TL-2023]
MAFSNFLFGLRKPKTDTSKQSTEIWDLGISSPRPLGLHDDPTTINLLKQGGLKRAPHIRRQHEPAQEAHLVQRHPRISVSDLASDGDLGLQGGLHRIGELYPEDEARQADLAYRRSRQISVTLGQKIRYPSESIVKTPVSKKFKVFQDFARRRELTPTVEDDHTSQGSRNSTFHSHHPAIHHPPPLPPRNLGPREHPIEASNQGSEATLRASIAPNGKYKIEESSFKKNFTYIRPLGEGSFGKVFLYKHKRSARLLAVKTTRKPPPSYISGLPSEVYIIRDILGNSHAHLPKLYHFHHSPARIEYWMDFCNSGDLVNLNEYYGTRCLRVPEGFIWHALTQLASALAFLHTGIDRADVEKARPLNWQPIIHRDIKPENVFLKTPRPVDAKIGFKNSIRYPTLVLGDFGLATTRMTSGERGHYIGTPAFQPPQLPIHTIWSDIWAIGAITHYLALTFPPISPQPLTSSLSLSQHECIASVREIGDVTTVGYSGILQDHLCQWLCWEETRRPVGLKGVLRAEAGRMLWLAEGGVEEKMDEWWGFVDKGGLILRRGRGGGGEGREASRIKKPVVAHTPALIVRNP